MRQIDDMLDHAIACHDEDSELVVLFWPWVCRARGWKTEEECSRAARRKWLRSLPALRVFQQTGPHSSMSRWMTYIFGLKWHMPYHYDRLLTISLILASQGLD